MKKIAMVTGASRGIGAATAALLAENGYDVCINYLQDEDKAYALVNTILKNGKKAIAVKADISSESQIIKLFETATRELGFITALVNNAGINGSIGPVEEMTAHNLQAVFSTNVFGSFLCCREAVKHMKQQGGGSIVNISSEAAKFGGNKIAAYASSKAAINAFTIGFAREVTPFNIRVNAVSPGVIDTELHAGSPPERLDALKNSLPMGRMGSSKEVAETIVWLLSDKASYISGSILTVAGAR
jgi:NAD(P)-dependent dehydrogenase (short-subunit alcohol dehydrogenase family)